MKRLFYLLSLVFILSACNEDEPLIQGPDDMEPGEVTVDSIEIELLDFGEPDTRNYFVIFDFTARDPGYI